MSYQYLEIEQNSSFITVCIAREEKRNALSSLVLIELKELLVSLQNSKKNRALILLGKGEKAFVAGADIKEMSQMSASEGEEFARLGQDVMNLLEQLPIPTIACVDGVALGGGCELAMATDFIYATEQSKFGQPEVNLGLIPCFGGCVRLPRLIGPALAKELIFTGRIIEAEEAARIGLVNRVFTNRSEMLKAATETISEILKKSPHGIFQAKTIINLLPGLTTHNSLEKEQEGFRKAISHIESTEGMSAFLEKRVPRFVIEA
ncbi:MAG: enoyl-CoA hydratase-related protein [Oligoflexia bacterium]|nr:enoyl-CoA hydratase-related protein [Oligoflexia bacterium]